MKHSVQLYKIRDFGEKINASIEYIRYNIGPLVKIVLLIAAPVGLLVSLLFSGMFETMFSLSALNGVENPEVLQQQYMSMAGSLMMDYLLMMVFSTVTSAFLTSAIYGYMKLKDTGEENPTVISVYKNILPKLPGLILLMFLITMVSGIGFVFFIIPGIYLMVTLSLAIPVYMFEEGGIGEAFSKPFRLVSGKWWSTLGLLFITGLIAMIVSYVFSIPFYMFTFAEMFTLDSNNPEAVMGIFSSWSTIAGMALMTVGSYLTYLIPVTALGFQYFNLSERVEGKGIRNQIQEFETLA